MLAPVTNTAQNFSAYCIKSSHRCIQRPTKPLLPNHLQCWTWSVCFSMKWRLTLPRSNNWQNETERFLSSICFLIQLLTMHEEYQNQTWEGQLWIWWMWKLDWTQLTLKERIPYCQTWKECYLISDTLATSSFSSLFYHCWPALKRKQQAIVKGETWLNLALIVI